MKALNTKLVLSALGIALVATPALAQKQQHPLYMQQGTTNVDPNYVGTYPNGAERTGSAASVESGADQNLLRD